MSDLFRLSGAIRGDPEVAAWFAASGDGPRRFIEPWFDRIRACGGDVAGLLHDGHPTACLGDVAFAYVDAFTSHSNVGFFMVLRCRILTDFSRAPASACGM